MYEREPSTVESILSGNVAGGLGPAALRNFLQSDRDDVLVVRESFRDRARNILLVAAGWTSGAIEMDRTIRFAAHEWRDGDKINKDKIASAISGVLAKTLAAKPAEASWNANTGKAKLTFKRPSPIYPPLALTETLEITALVSPDKPVTTDRLMLWISSPVITTADEGAGAKLHVSEDSTGDEEGGEPKDDNGSIEALAKEFKGQRWDADKSVWK